MTKRERYLAIAVAVVVGLFFAQYLFNKVSTTLAEKQDAIDAAMNENSNLAKTITSGKIAARRLEELQPKSLPKDQEVLRAQYSKWLTDLGQEVGMDEVSVKPPDGPLKRADAYTSYKFSLTGLCKTDRVLDLMGKFYDRDYLHTIKALKMNLDKSEANMVGVTMDVEAIALNTASPKQEPSMESSGRLAMELDKYKDIILNRNPFSPPNKAPRLSLDREYEIARGESWSLDLGEKTKDPESHKVDFELVSGDLPKGVEFRGSSFSGKPEENGKFELTIKAMDDGWPQVEIEKTFLISVVDPPPEEKKVEPPKFDVASQSYLTMMVSDRDGRMISIRSRTDGKKLELREGAEFELGSVKAKVLTINNREGYAVLETDGLRWQIDMDSSLAEAYAKGTAD